MNMNTYIKACGLAQYIDTSSIHNKQIRFHTSYDINELDKVLTEFLKDENIQINTSFKKGAKNRKSKIRYRRINKVSNNFQTFKKWINAKQGRTKDGTYFSYI